MTTKAQAFGREAFDFIEGVDRLYAPVAVMEAMRCVSSQFGFEWFVFTGLVPQPGQAFDDLLLSGLFPDGFRAIYANRDYGRSDPNVCRALHSSHPFEWTWTDYDEEDGPRAVEIMRILCVAKRTVDEHAQSAMRKLGAVNRTQAVPIAIRHRLFDI
jgi:hypothetical protein